METLENIIQIKDEPKEDEHEDELSNEHESSW